VEHSVIGACAAAGNLASPALSEAATFPYSSLTGPMSTNGSELRQHVVKAAKLFEVRAARCSRCEETLR
jgi:hypothetical protein